VRELSGALIAGRGSGLGFKFLAGGTVPFWPDVIEYDGGYDDAEGDSHDPVSNRVELGVGGEPLEDAHEEGEGYLQSAVGNSFAAGVIFLSIYLVATCSHLKTDISYMRFYC